MENKPILTNIYFPMKSEKETDTYEWHKHGFMTYFDDLKYEPFSANIDDYI